MFPAMLHPRAAAVMVLTLHLLVWSVLGLRLVPPTRFPEGRVTSLCEQYLPYTKSSININKCMNGYFLVISVSLFTFYNLWRTSLLHLPKFYKYVMLIIYFDTDCHQLQWTYRRHANHIFRYKRKKVGRDSWVDKSRLEKFTITKYIDVGSPAGIQAVSSTVCTGHHSLSSSEVPSWISMFPELKSSQPVET